MRQLWRALINAVIFLPAVITAAPTVTVNWTSAHSLPDGGEVTACIGGALELPWSFTIEPLHDVVNVEWYYQDITRISPVLLGIRVGDLFIPMNGSNGFKNFTKGSTNAGLRLVNVTSQASGFYTAQANILHDSVILSGNQQTVHVHVSDAPALGVDGFHASIDSLTVSQEAPSRELHVRLACGTIASLGHPAVTVLWSTPTNVTLKSTDYREGVFYLDINGTVPSGEYSCFVPSESSPLNCVDINSPLHRIATVSISPEQLRLTRLESQLNLLQQQNGNLFDMVQTMNGNISSVQQQNEQLNHQLGELLDRQTQLQSQNHNLQQEVHNLTSEVTEQRADNAQLLQQEMELTEKLNNVTETLSHHTVAMRDFEELPQNCQDVQMYAALSGQHTLFTKGRVYHVYCDQDTDGGGWTVIQRRQDGSENFFRGWTDYENGFGDVTAEHWIGLEKLHLLTSSNNYTLRIQLQDFDGNRAKADYSSFNVGDKHSLYRLHVSGYSGDAGDSLRLNYQQPFTTYDYDNDLSNGNCAVADHGGFWYGDCSNVNVNGNYKPAAEAAVGGEDGVYWYDWKNDTISLKGTVMMVKAV